MEVYINKKLQNIYFRRFMVVKLSYSELNTIEYKLNINLSLYHQ